MDFVYLFRVLLKRKWIIIGAALLASAIAYFFTRNEPKHYRSIAQISTGFTVTDDIKINDNPTNAFDAETKFNNAVATFTSPIVTSLLSYSLILHDLNDPAHAFRALNPQQKQWPAYKNVNIEEAKKVFENKLETMSMLNSYNPEEKKLLEFLNLYGYDYPTLSNGLSVYRLQRTDYIQIDYVSDNPELSAFVVNDLFRQFLSYHRSVRNIKSQESIDTLKSIMDKKKQELDAKNAILRGEGGATTDDGTRSTDLIGDLERRLTDEKGKQISLYYSLRKINQRLAGLGTSSKNTENNELIILKKEMNEAYTAYLNSGSTDKGLLNKYNSLKTQYQNKIVNSDSYIDKPTDRSDLLDKKNDIEVDLQACEANIQALQSRINLLKGKASSEASKDITVETFLKEADQANKDYLDAKWKYNNALDINASAVTNFRQVLMGQPAFAPEPSKRKLIILMAGAAAFIVSMLFIVLLAYLDTSIKTPAIFSKTVGLKLISMVNFMNLKNKSIADIITNKDSKGSTADRKRQNEFRESIRKLRYEIENTGKKIFLFTSTQKGEGKTTLIQALSYSMSLSKKKVLIIDTNFSNNDLTVQLHAEPILETISSYETEGPALIEQVRSITKPVGAGSVFAIGSTGGDYTPSEILPKENILHHLPALTEEYDYIFLEGPPLNDFSDSKELAQYVEGVIAVFSATHIIKQIDKESIAFFKDLNGKFCGAILNKIELENINTA